MAFVGCIIITSKTTIFKLTNNYRHNYIYKKLIQTISIGHQYLFRVKLKPNHEHTKQKKNWEIITGHKNTNKLIDKTLNFNSDSCAVSINDP